MSAGIETSIWLALKSRIESLPLTYPRAWPAQVFAVPSAGGKLLPFLRIGRVSVAPVSPYIDPDNPSWRTGALMVTLVYPVGQDVAVYDRIGSVIAEHFKAETQIPYGDIVVQIRSAPHVQEGYTEDGYWTVPVRIPWRCYA